MCRTACIAILALVLVACGGGDDAPGDTTTEATSITGASTASVAATSPPAAAATSVSTNAAAGTQASAASIAATNTAEATEPATNESAPVMEGAPPHEDPNFPDVHLPLEPGSNSEVRSMDIEDFEEDSSDRGTVRVTLLGIIDPATATNPIGQPATGNRLWAATVRLEATSDKNVNTGEWWLTTGDGNEYTTVFLTGVGEDIDFRPVAAGETKEGVVVFEIPETASVKWLKMDPSVYQGETVYFIAGS